MYAVNFPLCLGDFFGKPLIKIVVGIVGMKGGSAIDAPYGNDLQIPGVLTSGFCTLFQKGTLS
jgi:hypothetical protein